MQPLPGSNRSHPPCKKCRGGAKNAGGGCRKCTPADFAGVNAIWPAQVPHPCTVRSVVTAVTPPAKNAGGVQKMQGGGAENAPLQILQGSTPSGQLKGRTPAKSAPPAENAPLQNLQGPPADFAPGTVNEPEDSTSLLKDKDSVGVTPDLFAADKAKSAPKRQRATGERIPPDFTVDADMRKWAAEKIPGFNIDVERIGRASCRHVGKECRSRWSPYH